LTVKAAAAPAAATIAPPSAGPTDRARLKPMEFNPTAPGTCSRGTMSPTEACHAGLKSAPPQPMRKVSARRSHGVSHPAQATTASATETANMKACARSMIRRRSRLSASAPATSAKTMIGRVFDDCTSATIEWLSVISPIAQAAPTPWMSEPRFETWLASQRSRKVRLEKGARVVGTAICLLR